VSSAEDRFRAAMSAAADLAAREIPAAPPLRLPPEPAPGARRGRAPRPWSRWSRWTMPLTAAAAVVVLAIASVLIKDIPNGSVAPPNPSTVGPGGVPRYYVALTHLATGAVAPHVGIVVGDSLTGGTLATFAPPAGTTFASVTAAADDLTFAVFAVTSSTGSFAPKAKTTLAGRWYQVRLFPGADRPARLTPLPIKPVILLRDSTEEAGWAALDDSFAAALSGSGTELAVPERVASLGLTVKVFSVATGRLLHDWTLSDPALTPARPSLTWIDGDKSLALLSTRSTSAALSETAVREWPAAGPASGDLAAVSKVVWSLRNTPGSDTTLQQCLYEAPGGVRISADGKTFSCATSTPTVYGGHVRFYTFTLAASTTATAKGRLDAELRFRDNLRVYGYLAQVLWASPSGGTLIGLWIREVLNSASSLGFVLADLGPHIGVISHGRFAPVHFPAGFTLVGGSGIPIAW
jgi:hypothetical protein